MERIICYGLKYARNPSAVVPYSNMINHGVNSVVNKIHSSKIIRLVEESLKLLSRDKQQKGIVKSVRLFGST